MLSRADTFEQDVIKALPMLRRVAMGLCRDETRSDDIVQNTVVRALTNKDKFETGTNIQAWLVTILKNCFMSEFRKRKRHVEDPDEALAKAVPFDDNPVRKMEVAELLRLIDKMPDSYRIPLRLVADGASYEEIAMEICEQVGTVKSRVNRGRELLKAAD